MQIILDITGCLWQNRLVDKLNGKVKMDLVSVDEVRGNRKLFSKTEAQELVNHLNAFEEEGGWTYELEQGYNGPCKDVIGKYHIRLVDYHDGGYVVGYF